MLRLLLAMLATLLVTQAAIIATSVYLHRGLAHRALKLHPIADWIFRAAVPERTLYNWQTTAARLVAQDLRERMSREV